MRYAHPLVHVLLLLLAFEVILIVFKVPPSSDLNDGMRVEHQDM